MPSKGETPKKSRSKSREKKTPKKAEVKTSRSKSRSTSRSRKPKSPKARGKSPAAKSPARKRSTSRSRKTPTTVVSVVTKTPTITSRKTPTTIVSRIPVRAASSEEKVTSTVTVREELTQISSGSGDASFTAVRTMTRTSAAGSTDATDGRGNVDGAKPPQLALSGSGSPKLQKTSPVQKERKAPQPTTLFDVLGIFIGIILLPAIVYYVNLACKKSQCDVFRLPAVPKFESFIIPRAFLVFGVAVLAFAILSFVPVGRVMRVDGFAYRCNGKFTFWVSMFAYVGAWYLKYPVVEFVLRNFYALLTANFLFTVVLSVLFYIKSWGAPISALSAAANGNALNDYFFGRETNPRWGRFDFKWFLIRICVIFWGLVELTFLLQSLDRNNLLTVPKNIPVVMITLCHITWVWMTFNMEETMPYSPECRSDGFGYMLVVTTVYMPFFYSFCSRFAFSHNPVVATPLLVFAALLNVLGSILYMSSNNQKFAFRENPYDPRFANVASMSTGTDTPRLLLGGCWRFCRKPNYLGDIMMATSTSLMAGTTHAYPYLYPVLLTLLLLDRAWKDEAKCSTKYGRHWDAYKERVPYQLIPYVY